MMVFNNTDLNMAALFKDPISGDILATSYLVLNRTTQPILVTLGIFTNIINMLVFSRMKFKDTTSIILFFLSAADVGFLVIKLFQLVCYLVTLLPDSGNFKADPVSLATLSSSYSKIFFGSSSLLTTYLAVVRCFCVARPLHFRNTFTRSRTFSSVVVIVAVQLLTCVPVMPFEGLAPSLNATALRIFYSPQRSSLLALTDVVNRNVFPYSCLIIVLFCLMILSHSLKMASKFRNNSSGISSNETLTSDAFKGSSRGNTVLTRNSNLENLIDQGELKKEKSSSTEFSVTGIYDEETDSNSNVLSFNLNDSNESKSEGRASKTTYLKTRSPTKTVTVGKQGVTASLKTKAKEVRVIQVVTLVSVLFVVCNLPPALISLARTIEPEFTEREDYNNLFILVNSLSLTNIYITMSCNVLVYYRYNAKYKTLLRSMFVHRKKS